MRTWNPKIAFMISIALGMALAAPFADASERTIGKNREQAAERAQMEVRRVGEAGGTGKAGCPAGWTDMNAGGAGGPACVADTLARALKPAGEAEACPRPLTRKCTQIKPNWTICWCEHREPQE